VITANDIVKQVRPKEAGAADGARDFPPPNSPAYASDTEQDIRSLCQEEMANKYDEFARRVSGLRARVTTIRNLVPTDIVNRLGALKANARAIVLEHVAAIERAAGEAERRGKDLRQFKVLNDISYEPNYNDSSMNLIGTAALIIAVESAANSYFFGQASEAGLAGGFFTAGMISFLNVLVGFVSGALLLRQFNHLKKWRALVAAPPLAILTLGAIVFNVVVGHYREALLRNPDSLLIDIVPGALQNLAEIRSLESIILVVLGVSIFFFAMYEGYAVWDRYPGYMSKHKAWRDAEDNLKEEQDLANEEVNSRLGTEIADFDGIGPFLREQRSELETITQNVDALSLELESNIEQLEQAGDVAMKIYRAANVQVRSHRIPPPRYFHDGFKLHRSNDIPELNAVRHEISAGLSAIRGAEVIFEESQRNLAEERVAIVNDLAETLESTERNARARATQEREEEKSERESAHSAFN
jgi:hypothetical protein